MERSWSLAPAVLRVLAEGGWVSVLYFALSYGVEHRTPLLGPIELSVVVGLGMIVIRYASSDEELGPYLLVAAVIAASVGGWLVSPDARAMVVTSPLSAVGIHAAGWLTGLAMLRGILIGHGPTETRHIETLIARVLPGVALVWGVAGLITPAPLRPAFLAAAFWGTALFIVGALVSLGLARLNVLRVGMGDRGLRRRWRWLVVGCGIAAVPLAIPFALLSGVPLTTLLGPLALPFQWLIGLLAIPFGWFVDLLVAFLRQQRILSPDAVDEIQQIGAKPAQETAQTPDAGGWIGVVFLVILVILLVILVFAIARWLLGREIPEASNDTLLAGELEHAIVVPERQVPRPPSRRRTLRRAPAHDAVSAYVDALADLDSHPIYARSLSETPGHHAARTRAAKMPAWSDLSLLAADYQLATYGERRLTASEDRRALGRLQRLRRGLR